MNNSSLPRPGQPAPDGSRTNSDRKINLISLICGIITLISSIINKKKSKPEADKQK